MSPQNQQLNTKHTYHHIADNAQLLLLIWHEFRSFIVIFCRVTQDAHTKCFLLYCFQLLFVSAVRFILLHSIAQTHSHYLTLSLTAWPPFWPQCPENFVMISLMVQELLCWQTSRQTDRQIHTQTLLKTIPPSLRYTAWGGNYASVTLSWVEQQAITHTFSDPVYGQAALWQAAVATCSSSNPGHRLLLHKCQLTVSKDWSTSSTEYTQVQQCDTFISCNNKQVKKTRLP